MSRRGVNFLSDVPEWSLRVSVQTRMKIDVLTFHCLSKMIQKELARLKKLGWLPHFCILLPRPDTSSPSGHHSSSSEGRMPEAAEAQFSGWSCEALLPCFRCYQNCLVHRIAKVFKGILSGQYLSGLFTLKFTQDLFPRHRRKNWEHFTSRFKGPALYSAAVPGNQKHSNTISSKDNRNIHHPGTQIQ